MNHAANKRRGRPRKDEKVAFAVRIRRTVAEQFRRAMGPGMILCEAVEQALLEKLAREARR